MCGICGEINFERKIDKSEIYKMNSALYERGPDDEGYYFKNNIGLGMRRLSIIDIQNGKQPIINKKNNNVLICNGEIYNYIELRNFLKSKGFKFQTNSDVEVILYLYDIYGHECIKYLKGMFAFALWDNMKNELFIGRDRFGMKPLYFYKDRNRFIFSSTLKSIKNNSKIDTIINENCLLEYFLYGYIPSPNTIWKKIFSLPEAHYAVIKNENISIKNYWRIKIGSKKFSKNKIIEEINEKINLSIEQHLRSDVQVGLFYSGGMDSFLIKEKFKELSKKKIIEFVAEYKKKNNKLKLKKNITAKIVFERLSDYVDSLDQPISDSAGIPSFLLSEVAKKNKIKVIMSGAGADEIFGGYSRYYSNIKSQFQFDFSLKKILSTLLKLTNRKSLFVSNILYKIFVKKLNYITSISGNNFSTTLRIFKNKDLFLKKCIHVTKKIPVNSFKNNSLKKNMIFDQKNYLKDNILYLSDTTTMRNSVEMRLPFLDHEICEKVFSIEENLIFSKTFLNYKLTLRKIISKFFPKYIFKKKEGFNGPVSCWINNMKFKKKLKKIKSKTLNKYISSKEIDKVVNQKKIPLSDCQLLFSIMILDTWLIKNEE